MDLLEEPLPAISLRPDVPAAEFLDRCEAVARSRGYGIDRRRDYAGPGYDHLNLHLGGADAPPMVRMVATPRDPTRLDLDVVAPWSGHPIDYDEYLATAKGAYDKLLAEYAADYGPRLRLGISRKTPRLDMKTVNCGQIEYAQGKFHEAIRAMAVGAGDVRERLRSAWLIIHVVRSDDLPVPLKEHLAWVHEELTWREARHSHEGTLDATVYQMRRSTGAKIAKRILALADALDDIDERCRKARRS